MTPASESSSRAKSELKAGQVELKNIASDHSARMDSIEARLLAVERGQTELMVGQTELKSGQSELKNIVTDHTARLDLIDERLRAVERGHSEILGNVSTMNQVVLATLQREIEREPVGAD